MKKDNRQHSVRNIAIIAHVDHGKTTFVDALFARSGVFQSHQETEERIMDRMDLERERGITISAKNCAVMWRDVKINIIDTPGHADFGGEVERALSMADGAVLLVDAAEGPLPQTRFVLSKALHEGLELIVVINKIDRQDARPLEVLDEIHSLLIDLDADEHQLEFPLFYAVGRDGLASRNPEGPMEPLDSLLDAVIDDIPPPRVDPEGPFQMLVTDLGYSDYLGRLAVGRIYSGKVQARDSLVRIDEHQRVSPLRVSKIQTYFGPSMVDADVLSAGDILVLAGIEDVHIGDTICTREMPKALKRITVDEPTVSMVFRNNDSPLSGMEGSKVQSSAIHERLKKEALHNVSLSVTPRENGDGFEVRGRGEFQMAILIETMRREGFELCIGRPMVIFRYEQGVKLEPIEHLFVDCGSDYTGMVTEKLSRRKARMVNLVNHETGRVRMEFSIPSRGLIGYRDEFMTDTKGTGLLNSYVSGYEPYRGDIVYRTTGSLISDREGRAVAYALYNLEPRGNMFVVPGDLVYEGMIIGEHNREQDLNVNPCRTKKLSNVRAAGRDDAVVLTPILPISLERAIQYVSDDELVEVTPKSVRLRKAVLSASARK